MASIGERPLKSEETPLLQRKSKTPLLWRHITLIFVALIAEPISSGYVFPFINQLVGELGITRGDDRKIGYYSGLIESLFFVMQALMAWRWSWLSGYIGRRPVILLGLFGLSVSNFAFGLSRTLGMLIISRCIAGILNGNVGVTKSMFSDITDHTNMTHVFTLAPPIFCIGATIAPLYGGALAKPQERWPHIFQGEFWATYPYFLPSLVSGCFTLLTLFVCAIFMKESLSLKTSKELQLAVEDHSDKSPTNDVQQPVSMSTLLKTSSVMILITNYGTLGLLDVGVPILMPLFYSSSIEIGGLGFSPSVIGMFLATFGVVDGIVQALLAEKLIEWFGAKKVFCWAVLCFYPIILLLPVMSAIAMAQGRVGPIIWTLLVVQLTFMVLADLSFVVIFIFVVRSAPNEQSLGSVNRLSQSITSIVRAIGPALITSLFAVSKQYNILGGNLVYVILASLTTILVVLSRRLPDLKDEE